MSTVGTPPRKQTTKRKKRPRTSSFKHHLKLTRAPKKRKRYFNLTQVLNDCLKELERFEDRIRNIYDRYRDRIKEEASKEVTYLSLPKNYHVLSRDILSFSLGIPPRRSSRGTRRNRHGRGRRGGGTRKK